MSVMAWLPGRCESFPPYQGGGLRTAAAWADDKCHRVELLPPLGDGHGMASDAHIARSAGVWDRLGVASTTPGNMGNH